jgi:hypothetical protein
MPLEGRLRFLIVEHNNGVDPWHEVTVAPTLYQA